MSWGFKIKRDCKRPWGCYG